MYEIHGFHLELDMRTTKTDWLVPAALIGLTLVPAIAGAVRLTQLASGATVTPANARFFASPLPVVLHIAAAILYGVLGALQFSPGFRRWTPAWHRVMGRILLPCGFVVALSGLWMAHFYPWPPGDGRMVYVERLIFGSTMLVSLVLGSDAIRRRDFASHGAWMIRAYAIGLGAGTQVLTHVPWFILMPVPPGELARGIMMGAAWVINIVVAEAILRAMDRSKRARTVARHVSPFSTYGSPIHTRSTT